MNDPDQMNFETDDSIKFRTYTHPLHLFLIIDTLIILFPALSTILSISGIIDCYLARGKLLKIHTPLIDLSLLTFLPLCASSGSSSISTLAWGSLRCLHYLDLTVVSRFSDSPIFLARSE